MTGFQKRVPVARATLKYAWHIAAAASCLVAHVGHGTTLEQDIPRPAMYVMTRYEHLGMRAINFLATREWIYRNPTLRRAVEWVSAKIMSFANGEVLSLAEAVEMVTSIGGAGYTIATGTCPCRRAKNQISDEVPNNTDMVFGLWAETYLRNYPGLYKELEIDEARELLEEFDRHGFIHQVYGFNGKAGAAYVMCNCDKSVCIPLLAQKTRGYQAFMKGRSAAKVDSVACKGVADCGVCIERCPFDARSAGEDGKVFVASGECFGCGVCVSGGGGGATSLERIEGARLVYASPFVGEC